MAGEITVEEAKKDLQGMVAKEKSFKEKEKEKVMSESELKTLEDTRKKEQEEKTAKEVEAKKQADILAKKDEELSEEEKKTKTALLEEKRKEEDSKLSTDDKIKRIKEESQKRIDEVFNELKQIKDKNSKEAETLQAELKVLRQENETLNKRLTAPAEDDPTVLLKKNEGERLSKYLEEDSSKPKEQRREMSKEELSDWVLEDLESATEWITRRTNRRDRERYNDVTKLRQDRATKDFSQRQSESNLKVITKHPDLDTAKREAELKAQGKSNSEIHSTLSQENKKYLICSEIVKADPEKYLSVPNGPELVMQEMEKRLESNPATTQSESDKKVEDLLKRIEDLEAEKASRESEDVGVGSTVLKRKTPTTPLSEQEKILVETLKSLKTPQANIDSAFKKLREKRA